MYNFNKKSLLSSSGSGQTLDPVGWFNATGLPGLPTMGEAPPPSSSGSNYTQVALYGGSSTVSGSTTLGTTTVTNTTTSPTGTTVTSPFVINITWDSSVASAPSGFTSAVIAAAQYLESEFTNAVTVNIDIGYGEVAGTSLGSGVLGASESYLQGVSYSSLLSALSANNQDATNASVLASLPPTSPVNGNLWLTTAEAKSLGVVSPTATALDGYVGFSSSYPFTYNDANGVAAGTYDFNGVAVHELTEVLGRIMLTGNTIGSYPNSYTLYDLLHYSAPGVRDFSASTAGYFSVNGGTTNGGNLNTTTGGDAGDWNTTMGNDALNAFSNSGVINAVSNADLTALNALGWNMASSSTTQSPGPTGVAIAPKTGLLASAQASTGLAPNIALATITEVGGTSGDSFTYTLGGSGAQSFILQSSGVLSAGAAGVAGTTNGQTYALTLTANDITTGSSSSPAPFDVIVGSGKNDTISIEQLVGGASAAATPAFIYGLGGNDTVNGTGMTGKLWFVGGPGADTMTGGTGVNDYLYGSVSDSTAAAMDIITNFHAATDLIDLTGIDAAKLTFVGNFSGSRLAADSIGYKVSQGHTYIYVNTTGAQETLSATNMKIELAGSIALTSKNFLHN